MRSLFLLAALCCLVLSVCGSPIARSEDDKEVARQSAAPAPPVAATDEDDDDDDDDDDDLGLGVDDDDDDDDDEEDDDDDEEADDDDDDDYLERFFDDILGGDEDDDDEEPEVIQPVVAPADTVAAASAPVPAASTEEVANSADEGEVAETEAVAEDEEVQPGQKEPASAEVETPSNVEEAPAETDDEDDDDEDITDALDPEDDDDDDDDEEDDDDDDDDDIGDALGRNVSKQSRALEEPPKKPIPVPAVYVVKYNHFVDVVFEKMNDILKESYDPVSVKLQPIDATKKTTKPKKNKTKSNKRKSSNKKKAATHRRHYIKNKDDAKIDAIEKNIEANPKINELKPNEIEKHVYDIIESRRVKEKASVNSKAKPTTTKPKPPAKTTKPKDKPTKSKKPVNNKTKTKAGEKSKPRAKGTLYGLSSLRRTGDVAVSIKSNHTTIKSNFAVGPLVLKVEKEVGRGSKKELKSATATTADMTGKISLRVNNQGIATLHSIKVLQPKQVRVDSNHERTKELARQRSARIAHVVSEKLLTASRPMFQKQPVIKE